MDCTRIEELTADYLGDELANEERGLFQAHLEDCGACRARIEELTETLAELNDLRGVSLAVAAERTRDLCVVRRRPAWRRVVASSLKAAALLVFGVVLGRGSLDQGEQIAAPAEPSPIASTTKSGTGLHPRWIELGREVEDGRSSFTSRLLLLAPTADPAPQG